MAVAKICNLYTNSTRFANKNIIQCYKWQHIQVYFQTNTACIGKFKFFCMQIYLIRVTTSPSLFSCILNRRKTTIIAFVNSNFSNKFSSNILTFRLKQIRKPNPSLLKYSNTTLTHWHTRKKLLHYSLSGHRFDTAQF